MEIDLSVTWWYEHGRSTWKENFVWKKFFSRKTFAGNQKQMLICGFGEILINHVWHKRHFWIVDDFRLLKFKKIDFACVGVIEKFSDKTRHLLKLNYISEYLQFHSVKLFNKFSLQKPQICIKLDKHWVKEKSFRNIKRFLWRDIKEK